jgi:ribosomal protein S18 acetylase RimI-like enzyme
MIEIVNYAAQYAADFKRLNLEWLQQYFTVELHDEEMLSQPAYITDNGGYIFIAKEDNTVVGTAALIKHEDGFELSKMSVSAGWQGRGISKLLMDACITKANNEAATRIFLYSNTMLVPAISLYRKFGFKELPLEENSNYRRNNIKMELQLK